MCVCVCVCVYIYIERERERMPSVLESLLIAFNTVMSPSVSLYCFLSMTEAGVKILLSCCVGIGYHK